MTPTPGLISVLLVNYNGRAHLEECLGSLERQTFRGFEVIMVDNGSADGSLDFVRERFSWVRLVDAGANLGFAGGNNLGLQHCRGEWIFFLNNDTRTEPNALENLSKAIRTNADYRVFACFMLNYRNPELVDNAGELIYTNGLINGYARTPASLFTTSYEVASACGGAAVFARSVLDEIGGFDEDFFLLFEDIDLSQRARHNGERLLFLPEVRVHHKGSATIGGSLGKIEVYYTARNFVPLYLKTFPLATLIRISPWLAFSLVLRVRAVLVRGRFLDFLQGFFAGLALLPRMLRKRRKILGASRIDRREFERLFRPGYFRERRAITRQDFTGIP